MGQAISKLRQQELNQNYKLLNENNHIKPSFLIFLRHILFGKIGTLFKTNQYRCLIWNETFDSKIEMNGLG